MDIIQKIIKKIFEIIKNFLNTRILTNILLIILLIMLAHAWDNKNSIGDGNYIVEEKLRDLNSQVSSIEKTLNDIQKATSRSSSYSSYSY